MTLDERRAYYLGGVAALRAFTQRHARHFPGRLSAHRIANEVADEIYKKAEEEGIDMPEAPAQVAALFDFIDFEGERDG